MTGMIEMTVVVSFWLIIARYLPDCYPYRIERLCVHDYPIQTVCPNIFHSSRCSVFKIQNTVKRINYRGTGI